jgi:hypothetical protein
MPLPNRHEILRVFKAFTLPDCNGAYRKLFAKRYRDSHIRRNDPGWNLVLIKEVHALLATEAIIDKFNCPMILLLRNPVYIIDSLFFRDGTKTLYLRYEDRQIRKPQFLQRYCADHADAVQFAFRCIDRMQDNRSQAVARKVLSVALIHEMFRVLAEMYPEIRLLRYEALCVDPERTFADYANWMGFAWDEGCNRWVESTCHGRLQQEKLSRISQKSVAQIDRPFRFLTNKEASLCREVLEDCGFNYEG